MNSQRDPYETSRPFTYSFIGFGFSSWGIVSPHDDASSTTIMRPVKVPGVLASFIEVERLLNEAFSLIVFRFALAAVITGQFYLQQAAGNDHQFIRDFYPYQLQVKRIAKSF